MMRALALLLAPLLIAGCLEPDPRVQSNDEPEVVPMPEAPPPDPRRYIGRWAQTAEECTTDWYRFWANEILTADRGLACDIFPPDSEFSDTELRVTCRGGGGRQEWSVSYADEGNRMSIATSEDETLELVKCT
ncbi:MAG: hypothetical protein WA906_07750 [Pacificimonas sp.]